MKIAITGHTKGIGQAMCDWFSDHGHSVVGFSRSTGFDINDADALAAVARESSQCDVLINNAYAEFAQVKLLYIMHDMWQGLIDKTHVVIGSQSPDWQDSEANVYIVAKTGIDRAVKQLTSISTYRLTNVRPGWVDTSRCKHVDVDKLSPHDLASTVCPLLIDRTIYITDMTLKVPHK
jgi:NADP-dependent 3-hydroxy acid dehydrogenase YdfG